MDDALPAIHVDWCVIKPSAISKAVAGSGAAATCPGRTAQP